jgi:hypothetical protein
MNGSAMRGWDLPPRPVDIMGVSLGAVISIVTAFWALVDNGKKGLLDFDKLCNDQIRAGEGKNRYSM